MDIAGHALTAEDAELLQHPMVTGWIAFSRNFADREQMGALTAAIRRLRPDLLLAVDYEGGRVQRFHGGMTRMPSMRALAASSDPATATRAAATVIAMELAALDFDLPFAPVADLDFGCSTVIGDRAFARAPATVAALAGAFVDGLSAAGMAATAKHFPGHGGVAPDSHVTLPVDVRTRAELDDDDLAAFRPLLVNAVASVMMAHVVYPDVDDRPASLSPVWIGDILRGELGFTGAVVCDDLSMGGAAAVGGPRERAEQAASAGCDLLPVCNDRSAVIAILDGGPLDMADGFLPRLAALRRRPAVADAMAYRTASLHLARLLDAGPDADGDEPAKVAT